MKLLLLFLSVWGRVVAILPARVMYCLSDGLAFLLWGVVRYRRSVVKVNLARSFPQKSPRELRRIAWLFYRHLADLFHEILVLRYGSKKRVESMYVPCHMEAFAPYTEAGQSVVVAASHYGNWEVLSLTPLRVGLTMLSVYKPLYNKPFDKFMHTLRSRWGSVPVPMRRVLREVVQRQRDRDAVLLGLISDQTPPYGKGHYWGQFLNQETKAYRGVEVMAKQFNMPVFFSKVRRLQRGVYSVEPVLITDTPRDTPEDYITQQHMALLEKSIQENPPYWLWSHKRWKHSRATDPE